MLLEYNKGVFLCVRDPWKRVKRARLGFIPLRGSIAILECFLTTMIVIRELFNRSDESMRELC